MKMLRNWYLQSSVALIGSIALIALVLLLQVTPALADSNPNPGVLPPNSRPNGLTYGEWSNAWWQWAFSTPPASNPVLDTTGANCGVGQSGQVWFLAGVFGTGTATRNDCTVPAGKKLFFPIWNIINVAINGDCSHSTDTVDTLRAVTNQLTEAQDPTTYKVRVDGESIPILPTYRAGPNNPSFNFIHLSVATVNVAFGLNCANGALNSPPYLAVSDGYYLMLAPLTPGMHTIHFEVPNSQNITYNLTVKG